MTIEDTRAQVLAKMVELCYNLPLEVRREFYHEVGELYRKIAELEENIKEGLWHNFSTRSDPRK